MARPLPGSIRIQGRDFKISLIKSLTDAATGNERMRSECDWDLQAIRIDAALSADHRSKVLTCQVVSLLASGLALDQNIDRATINRLGVGLHSVFVDNESWWHRRPTREWVWVFGRRYRIRYCEGPIVVVDEGKLLLGQCDHNKGIIRISNGPLISHWTKQAETILHEVIHVIDLDLHLSMSENEVEAMSTAFFQVLQDNPRWW